MILYIFSVNHLIIESASTHIYIIDKQTYINIILDVVAAYVFFQNAGPAI